MKSEFLKNPKGKLQQIPKEIDTQFCEELFISSPLDHTVVGGLPSNYVQHWEYVVNGDSEISVLNLTKL